MRAMLLAAGLGTQNLLIKKEFKQRYSLDTEIPEF
jgi:hypothetical protein